MKMIGELNALVNECCDTYPNLRTLVVEVRLLRDGSAPL
jgi:hypothetical protein